jgi:hypothetical protein
VWNRGFPEDQGWYDCKVDGKPERLFNWVCIIDGHHVWKDIGGTYVKGDIQWTPG